jgi:hypothetical protein
VNGRMQGRHAGVFQDKVCRRSSAYRKPRCIKVNLPAVTGAVNAEDSLHVLEH